MQQQQNPDVHTGIFQALTATSPNILIDDVIGQLKAIKRGSGPKVSTSSRAALESEAKSILLDFAKKTMSGSGGTKDSGFPTSHGGCVQCGESIRGPSDSISGGCKVPRVIAG